MVLQLTRIAMVELAGACACGAVAQTLLPLQQWPNKPIRLIVSVPAGGAPDLAARTIAPGVGAVLGQSLVVDNRGGAGGLIGAELAAKAAPDGYTLFVSNPSPLVILPLMVKQPPYDAMRDFVPISLVSIGYSLLVTHPSRP